MSHILYQDLAEPIDTTPPPAAPELSWWGHPPSAPPPRRPADFPAWVSGEELSIFPAPDLSWQPMVPDWITFRRTPPSGVSESPDAFEQALTAPTLSWRPSYPPTTLRRQSTPWFYPTLNLSLPILPFLPTLRGTTDPRPVAVLEQSSGSWLARITDEAGNLIPGSMLTRLRLSLYVIRQDGTTTSVNGRSRQDVLNANNVTVYDVVQTTPSGMHYNLRWQIQPADTTLVESIPFERHLGLIEWDWPGGQGKQEFVLVVRNLSQVH
jgi:hypothetical protein